MSPETFLALVTINMLAWLTPGPNMLVIISAAIQSRRDGYFTALGVGFGGVIWGLLAVSGVAIVFELFPKAALVLQMFEPESGLAQEADKPICSKHLIAIGENCGENCLRRESPNDTRNIRILINSGHRVGAIKLASQRCCSRTTII